MIKLSKRLLNIATLVPKNSYIADVGADHGKLGIYLLENKIVKRVQSIENKIGPFSAMKKNYLNEGLEDSVNFSLSDGLENLDSQVDTIVIAGMGGLLIKSIIEKDISKLINIKTIIIDAHRDVNEVRKSLIKLGYIVDEESMVYEDKQYYSIIRFCKSDEKVDYSKEDLLFGPVLLKKRDQLFLDYLNNLKNRYESLINQNLDNVSKEKYQDLLERINKIL